MFEVLSARKLLSVTSCWRTDGCRHLSVGCGNSTHGEIFQGVPVGLVGNDGGIREAVRISLNTARGHRCDHSGFMCSPTCPLPCCDID